MELFYLAVDVRQSQMHVVGSCVRHEPAEGDVGLVTALESGIEKEVDMEQAN